MRRSVLFCAGACLLLCQAALWGDILHLSDRGRVQGTVQELIVRVDGLPRVYQRADLRAANLSETGDAIELADGARVHGEVLSLTIRCADKLCAYGRSRLKSVTFEELLPEPPAATPAEAPVAVPAAEPAPRARELTPEELASQKKGLTKNEEFCKQFLAKAGKRGIFGSTSKAEDRKKRILAMAELIKGELLAGRLFTDGQMHQRYEAALEGRPFSESTKTQLRTMAQGVKVNEGPNKDVPELVVEPFPELKY